MTKSDKKYYESKARQDDKKNIASKMAKARGDAAVKWMKTNILTKETQAEFNRLMKKTDRDFKKQLMEKIEL